MFADDRDLLLLEPDLFRQVGWNGQRVIRTTGRLDAGTLRLDEPIADRVKPAMVVTAGDTSLEVIESIDEHSIVVSLIRADRDDPPLEPPDALQLAIDVTSFRPQIASVHNAIMRMLALPDGAAVLNADDLREVEAVGAMHLVLSSASLLAGNASPIAERRDAYGVRFNTLRRAIRADVDTDGDGQTNMTRWASVVELVRG